jgi:hypothetical protein
MIPQQRLLREGLPSILQTKSLTAIYLGLTAPRDLQTIAMLPFSSWMKVDLT